MSQGLGPVDLGVKRSKIKVTMHSLGKIFHVHKCLPFTPILMKLHRHTPHESRMGPVDFRVKRSKVKVTMHRVR